MHDPLLTGIQAHYVGLKGEYAVACLLGLRIDEGIYKFGDSGYDLIYIDNDGKRMTIDVKCSQTRYLIFDKNKFLADAAVLTRPYNKETQQAGIPAVRDFRLATHPKFGYEDIIIYGWLDRHTFYDRCFTPDWKKRKLKDAVPLEKLFNIDDLMYD